MATKTVLYLLQTGNAANQKTVGFHHKADWHRSTRYDEKMGRAVSE
ncbi:MAG: hypothetical protein ACRCVV_07280 [Shewanella sp.]